jgi:ABC-type enterochelin transport system ATPase subunit
MPSGLKFHKLDLHIHTCGSYDFPNRDKCTAEDFVKEALNKGLDGIAVTDHDTGSWIDKIKDAAKGTKLIIFPGVEITCEGGKEGIHVIALFDPSKGSNTISGLLEGLGIPSEKHGTTGALVAEKIGVIGVIEEVDKRGGIAIPAHVNSTKGVLEEMRGQQRTRIIKCKKLLAVEATDFKKAEGKRTVDFMNGKDQTYKRKLAVYQASDSHSLNEIGLRCAYFKMEQVNLDGLRQCFIDPDVRIKQDFEFFSTAFQFVKSISIRSGFLENQTVNFHSGLNSIIGAKGAGKSLIIEFLRFALNQEPKHSSIADDHISKLQTRLGEYGEVEVRLQDETGREFTIQRIFRELDHSPYGDDIPFDPAQIFPILFLSQNEIIKIAEKEELQLEFIDRFFDFHAYKSEILDLEHQLEELDKKMAEGLRAYSEVDELSTKIVNLKLELEKLDKALAHPIFENFKKLETKENVLQEQNHYLSSLLESVTLAKDQILARASPEIPEELVKDPALLRNRDLIEKANSYLANQFSLLIEEIKKEQQSAASEYSRWFKTLQDGKLDYGNYIKKMGSDFQGLALQRDRVNRQLIDLKRQNDIASKKKNSLKSVSDQRNILLDQLENVYKQYTQERREKCNKFQIDSLLKLKLQILDSSNVDEFRTRLLSLKRGSYVREDDILQICKNVNPREFVLTLLRYDTRKETKRLEDLTKAASIEMRRMQVLADWLLSSIEYEELLALQYKAYPQDRPDIQYNIGDGHYQPLANVSVGQKCTAMLIMALSDGTMPIVIDQPEDSLDIRSIWEDMCIKLRLGKEKRQFIFTTHNSSLAVASDTDCFSIIEGTATNGKVVHSGSMDHDPMSDEVLKYLEGGKDTYHLKLAKYDLRENN